jgi:predicted Zn finger-like uncharacterized protein
MKIACDSCGAKYTIADEKVAGRVVKIKCKKCSSTIVVNGTSIAAGDEGPAQGQPSLHAIEPYDGYSAGAEHEHDPEASTQLFAQDGSAADDWTVNVADDDQRGMTTAEIVAAYGEGSINADTYVWRDGMEDWLTLAEIPELVPLLSNGAEAEASVGVAAPFNPSPMEAQQPYPAPAAGGAFAMAESPRPAAAARRADARRPKVDLFGAGDEVVPPPSQPPLDKHVGERNENSVLFSLSALAAAEEAAAKPAENERRAAPLGRSPLNRSTQSRSASPARANGRAGIEDLMNLGGGSIMQNPALAPPDLLAPPPPEPPPPPPSLPPQSMGPGSVHPGMGAMAQMPMHGMPMPYGAPPQKKPLGLIIGIGGAVALVAVIGTIVAVGGDDDAEAVAANTTTETPSTEATDKNEPEEEAKADDKADDKADEDEKDDKKDEDEGDEKASAEDEKEAEESLGANATPEQKAAFLKAKKDAKKEAATSAKSEEPKKKKEDDKKKEEPKTSGATKEFSRAEATAALGAAAGSAQGCAKKGGPTGMGKAQVTFAPSGRATSATVGGPFAGTAVGSCVASIFRSASVSPFKGGAVTVSKSFRIK